MRPGSRGGTRLSDSARAMLASLPPAYGPDAASKAAVDYFVTQFGTHYMSSATSGGAVEGVYPWKSFVADPALAPPNTDPNDAPWPPAQIAGFAQDWFCNATGGMHASNFAPGAVPPMMLS